MTATGTPAPSAPQTLAQALSGMSDDALVLLMAQRPDLVRLLPDDFSGLATACASHMSVRLIWQRLDMSQRQVLEVLAAMPGPVSIAELEIAVGGPVADVVRECRALGLAWGDDETLRPVSGLAQVVGPAPCGLDPIDRSTFPRIAAYLSHPDELREELAEAPPGVVRALDRLLWGPPRGSVTNADRPVSAASARTPVEWLLARGLLVPADRDAVVLPREIALLLRHGRYVRQPALPPGPPVLSDAKPIADADATAAMHALMFTRHVAAFLEILDAGGIRQLRTGGIYQRDAAELARRLGVGLADAALVTDVAQAAGLMGAEHETGLWRQTRQADVWRALAEPQRWAVLANAWLSTGSHAALAADGERRLLSDDLASHGIADVRLLALQVASTTAPGQPVDVAALTVSVAWARPALAGSDLGAVLAEVLGDAETVGLFGRGAISRAGRVLAGQPASTTALSDAVRWPALVDQVLVQADLTASALGPMTLRTQERLSLLADQESAGAGAVYRISAESLTRGFDAGMGAEEVLAELQQLSVTPVPPTVETLVRDVGRRHGSVSVLPAASVITASDDAALTAALADKTLQRLRLRRVAPGVVISQAPVAEVTKALRQAGVAAVGATSVATRPPRLAPPRPVRTQRPDDDLLQAAVRAVRAGEAAREALEGPMQVSALTPHDLLDLLSDAIRRRQRIWLDFADPAGLRKVRLVEPLTLRAGLLSGFDHREQRVVGFPLARIAGVAVVEAEG